MTIPTILYHDVVDGDWDRSGFAGAAAARYKLRRADFARHLAAIAGRPGPGPSRAVSVLDVLGAPSAGPFLFTVDDGGASALHIADALEKRGWIGHFFITTDRIGTPGFLSAGEIRDLDCRGHVLGSHSCSHASWMSELPEHRLFAEWSGSRARLADITGHAVDVGSVPGGYYAPRVAMAAARSGLRVLFTSEPTTECTEIAGCTVLGRYTVYRGMTAAHAARLVAGSYGARPLQSAVWSAKKIAKTHARPLWQTARHLAFGRGR